jgi:MoaA/NifB/PqqE/SkfB family radical SAM enzyme
MAAALFLTYRCNNNCFMCHTLDVARERNRKGLREMDGIGLNRLSDGFADLGVSVLSLTGGEPLLHPDIIDVVAHARTRGLIVHLNTNGMLVDEVMAKRLVEAGLDSVNLSLDGAVAETHDRLRRTRGGFARIEGAIANFRKARRRARDLTINVVSVVSSENLAELPAIVALTKRWGADSIGLMPAQFFALPEMRPQGDPGITSAHLETLDGLLAELKDDPFLDSSEDYLDLFRDCLTGKPSPLECTAGHHTLTVDCFGNVYRCFPFGLMGVEPHPLGDLTLPEWWASREGQELREEARACHACYWNCHTEVSLMLQR